MFVELKWVKTFKKYFGRNLLLPLYYLFVNDYMFEEFRKNKNSYLNDVLYNVPTASSITKYSPSYCLIFCDVIKLSF